MENLLARITLNPNVGHGKPTIRNKRYLVKSILEYLAGGDSAEDLLAQFPDLEQQFWLACNVSLNFSIKILKKILAFLDKEFDLEYYYFKNNLQFHYRQF